MTVEEAVEQLGAIWELQRQRGVREDDHVDADVILLELIDNDRVSQAYHSIERWYA